MLPVEPVGDPARGACDARVVGARVVVLVENSQKSRPEVPTDATALSHTVGLFKSSFSTSAMRRFAVLRAEARGREDGATMALEPSASDRPAM